VSEKGKTNSVCNVIENGNVIYTIFREYNLDVSDDRNWGYK
jgi:hypothetical protein